MDRRLLFIPLIVCLGCGTTKWTDTSRTATEQLLLADSMERAVSQIDFRALAGKLVYLDDTYVKGVTDSAYLTSSLRQHILASGAILKEKRDEADYIVEARAGAVGTDHHDVLFGVPQTTVPSIPLSTATTTTIPEIPLVKRTDQRAVTKVAVFAYNRVTGRPIWQSGVTPGESKAKAVWVFGAGPFQRGTIYEGTKFAGGKLDIPLVDLGKPQDGNKLSVSVAQEAYFSEPRNELAKRPTADQGAAQAKPAETAAPTTPDPTPMTDKTPAKAGSPVVPASHSGPAVPIPVTSATGEAPAAKPAEAGGTERSPNQAMAPAPLPKDDHGADSPATPWPRGTSPAQVYPLPPIGVQDSRDAPYWMVDPLPYTRR